jgi:D-glycero-D-manno-heptose 1,7-bisphosphate phosphatase
LEEKLAEFNISLDGIYFCPHHKEGKIKRYTKDCSCRKPKPGLLLKAKEEHNLDLRSSFLIGDKISDIGAGFNAGCKTILVLTGFGKEELEKKSLWEYHPDYIAEDLFQAVCWIINNVNEDKRT